MLKMMTYEAGHRAAVTVGAGTLVIGGRCWPLLARRVG